MSWASGRFMSGQQYQGWDNMGEFDKELTQIYDEILDRATLTEGVVVTRRSDAQLVMGAGIREATLEELLSAKGQTLKVGANMSTGAASQGLTIGDDSKRIEYKIRIPAGSTGAGMWIGDDRINHWGPGQREFMTNRDILVRVGTTTYDASRDIYTVELQYFGREEHDYGTSGKVF